VDTAWIFGRVHTPPPWVQNHDADAVPERHVEVYKEEQDHMKRASTETTVVEETTITTKVRLANPELVKIFETATPVVYLGSQQSQALRMAVHSKADEPIGTASIASCMALVLALVSDEAVKAKLLSFLGFRDAEQLLSLKDQFRSLSALLSPAARAALERSPGGAACKMLWEAMGAECIPLQACLEDQVNEMLKKAWETDENVFKRFQIVPEHQVKDLIAALVSMEKIKVSWKEELDFYREEEFTTASGEKVPAKFCADEDKRTMSYLTFEGGEAVLLPCKPDEKTGKLRGMIFVLPPEDDQNLDTCLKALAAHADKDGKGLVFDQQRDYAFSFPAFDAKKAPGTILPWLSEYVPELFDPASACMEGTLPAELVNGVAYVGEVQHGASIKADRKGAEAKGVTVAAVVVYRSLPPPPKEFKCNRPFLSILATLKAGTTEVENVEFVTKHETSETLDLTVE
jgi:hypothetical protein